MKAKKASRPGKTGAEQFMAELNLLADKLVKLSCRGEEVAQNDRQRLFFTVVRDCAFKIKQEFYRAGGES